MFHLPSLQAVLLVVVAAVSCVHGISLPDPSTELRQGHFDAETVDVLSVNTGVQEDDLLESRRSLMGFRYKKKFPPVAIASSFANSKAKAGRGGVAIADSLANSKARAGKGGLAIASSTANSKASAGY